MSTDQNTLREIDWREIAPGLILLRTARIAKDLRKLCLAAVAMVLVTSGWWAIGQILLLVDDTAPGLSAAVDSYSELPWVLESGTLGTLAAEQTGLAEDTTQWLARNPVLEVGERLTRPFFVLFSRATGLVLFTYLLLGCLWTIAVWGLFGGAISRLAALELSREERCSVKAAFIHAWQKWSAYFWAPVIPLFPIALFAVLLALPALLMTWDAGVAIVGIGWGLMLFFGFAMAFIGVMLLFGWPLMWGAIAVESSDTFDAVSRSLGYTLQRPLRYAGYAAVLAVLGIVAWPLIAGIAGGVGYLTAWGASWGANVGDDPARFDAILAAVPDDVQMMGAKSTASETAAGLDGASSYAMGVAAISFWSCAVKMMALGFMYSYFWTGATATYLLLRRNVDGTELEEVPLTPEETEARRGLPKLRVDESGIPAASEETEQTGDESAPSDARKVTESATASSESE